ncbi:MAG: right-handed parallel beta-helix repeat-containing protein [Acidobacteria bacterium]|nr:right-handed parallel beta-helix repeat-containing protein [Acidobacteriota bacterium]
MPAAWAQDALLPGTPELDRPTPSAIGIRLPVRGDDNYNATVSAWYRAAGSEDWWEAHPLFRVRPETVLPWTIEPQFAGSIFDLRPGTRYDVVLRIQDPDGPIDEYVALTARTRHLPRDPAEPNERPVTTSEELRAALRSARPGDVITLGAGIYPGQFVLNASGTEDNPIVIRGAGAEQTALDGEGCTSCNILEVYGSFVHLERFAIRNGLRALRFQTAGARGNAARRLRIEDTRLGMAGRAGQLDFYIADNILEGRLEWPRTYRDDNGAHANDDGIQVLGHGHVVAHNRISGFGDAIKTEFNGARSVDIYGNEILFSYDNGIELDYGEGNVRCLRNRILNTYSPISVQPVLGGPAYVLRNVVLNVVDEQVKFHGSGRYVLSGVLVYNNTFVSPASALLVQTPAPSSNFALLNNLFVGPANPPRRVVNWDAPIVHGRFDYNGYFPDGAFTFNLRERGGYQNFASFAAVQAGGLETNGVLLSTPVFESGLEAPPSYTVRLDPRDPVLDAASNAVDRAVLLPNVNEAYTGTAPDLGALERGCAAPVYGPRPEGMDESNQSSGCEAAASEAGARR